MATEIVDALTAAMAKLPFNIVSPPVKPDTISVAPMVKPVFSGLENAPKVKVAKLFDIDAAVVVKVLQIATFTPAAGRPLDANVTPVIGAS